VLCFGRGRPCVSAPCQTARSASSDRGARQSNNWFERTPTWQRSCTRHRWRRSTRSLGIMIPPPRWAYAFSQLLTIGVATHVICSIGLRCYVRQRSPMFPELFAEPALSRGIGPWLLRVRYFFPWVPAPALLTQEKSLVRYLFWGARLGGAVIILGLCVMVGIMIYVGFDRGA
jgi:hypothetical protein